MPDNIDDIVSKRAEEQLSNLRAELKGATEDLSGFQKVANTIEIKLGNTDSIVKLNALLKELFENSERLTDEQVKQARAAKDLADAELKRAKAATERVKTQQEELKVKEKLQIASAGVSKEIAKEEKQLKAVASDYTLLAKAYQETALKAKNYALQLGANHPLTIQAIADAKNMDMTLKALDLSVGQHGRNVGNYNGIQAQFNQLLREVPNAGISVQTFITSLSNNFTYMGEAIKTARAEGQSWKTIIGTMAGGLFSFVGIMNIAVALFVAFGAKLFETQTEAEKAAESMDKLTKATEAYRKEVEAFKNPSFSDTEDKNISKTIEARKRNLALLKAQGAAASVLLKEENTIRKMQASSIRDEIKLYEQRETSIIRFDKEIYELKQKLADTENDILVNNAQYETELRKEQEKKDKEAAHKREEMLKEWRASAEANYTAQYNTQKEALENEGKLLLDVAKDENESVLTRTQAFADYYQLKIRLITEAAEYEKSHGRKTAVEIAEIERQKGQDLRRLSDEALNYDISIIDKEEKARKAARERERKALLDDIDINNKAAAKGREEEKKKHEKFYDDLFALASKTAGDIINAFKQANQTKLNDELTRIDQVQKSQESAAYFEIERIKASGKTSVQAQDEISKVEARLQAQRVANQEQQRQAKQRQASADKAAAILQIILNTSIAVIKALRDGATPADKILGAALAAATGAAQLAIAQAAPLPQYADGTQNHKGGAFVAGDGGESELVVTPSGKVYATKDTPTVYNEAKGTKVLNQDMVNKMGYALFTPQIIRSLNQGGSNDKRMAKHIEEASEKSAAKIVSAIKQNRTIVNNSIKIPDNSYNRRVKGR